MDPREGDLLHKPTVGYYPWILPLPASVHFFLTRRIPGAVPTRQTSSSGRPKSPRIQVVLPEELCERLSVLAEDESRTVSNMAKVLIQQGVERLERLRQHDGATAAVPGDGVSNPAAPPPPTPAFIPALSHGSPGLPAPAATVSTPAVPQPPAEIAPTPVPQPSAPSPTAPPSKVPPSTPVGLEAADSGPVPGAEAAAERFRAELERNEAHEPRRLRGVPRRLKLRPPGG